jgi:MFS family permease
MTRNERTALTRNVVMLGLVSLLTDAGSEMVMPFLPLFLTATLGGGALALGWIEGLADAVSSVLKLMAGRWSDRLGRRKPLIVAGYGLAAVVRPLIALALAPWHVLAVRVVDRTGKGLRTSPRDALLAASVEPSQRATAFALHRAMDHAGAVIGPLAAIVVVTWWTDDLRTLFWLTAIPGALCMAVLLSGVRETPSDAPAAAASRAQPPAGSLTRLLIPLGLFTLGNASDVFLLLKAGSERASLTTLPLLWMALHVVKAAASVPGGRLADRFGKRRVIAGGWLVYAAIYTGFAYAQSQVQIALLFVTYGLYHGLTEGPEKALVAELTPAARWGAAFGAYHLVMGLLALCASVLFGALWDVFGSRVAFLTSAALALAALICLALLAPRGVGRTQ